MPETPRAARSPGMPVEPHDHRRASAPVQPLGATRAELLEHVMRLTDDDLIASPFLAVEPGSTSYLAHLGRLLSHGGRLSPDTPLHRYAQADPGTPDLAWRDTVTPVPRSLWSELEMLRTLMPPVNASDPLTELHLLRALS